MRRPGARRRALMASFLLLSVAAIGAAALLVLRVRHPGLVLKRYDYAVVTRKDITNQVQFPGIVDFATTTTLTAPAGARVESVLVDAGAVVRKGQVVVHLRSSDVEQALRVDADLLARKRRDRQRLVLDRAAAAAKNERDLALAEVRARGADDAAEAARALFKGGFASKAELNAAEQARAEAAAELADVRSRIESSDPAHELALSDADQDVRQAEAQVQRDRDLLESLSIRSPFDGKIVQLSARAGAAVESRATLLTVVDQAAAIARFEVPERQVGKLAVGQPLTITVGGTRHAGRVATIAAQATGASETTSSSVTVTAAFTQTPAGLLPGASASAELVLGFQAGALTLPRGPYLTTGGDAWLFVISGDRAVKTPVSAGVQGSAEVEISSGVSEGQEVIVSSYEDFLSMESVQIDPAGGTRK